MKRGLVDGVREALPAPLVQMAKTVLNGFPSLCLGYLDQAIRFNKSYARDLPRGGTQLEAKIIYYTHQIEKGLSHRRFRRKFGKKVLSNLASALTCYLENDASLRDSLAYRSAIAALKEYEERHKGDLAVRSYFNSIFSKTVLEDVDNAHLEVGGSEIIGNNARHEVSDRSLRQLLSERHSIREYSDRPVMIDEILPALELATRSPSACNRQAVRVRAIVNPDLIRGALGIASGFGGYSMPSLLFLVTSDNRVYFGPQERNEGFVDGGIFCMTLLLALEDAGLAACPLNTMLRRRPEKQMRRLLHLKEWEEMVMFISVGHFRADENLTCRSARKDVGDIFTIVD